MTNETNDDDSAADDPALNVPLENSRGNSREPHPTESGTASQAEPNRSLSDAEELELMEEGRAAEDRGGRVTDAAPEWKTSAPGRETREPEHQQEADDSFVRLVAEAAEVAVAVHAATDRPIEDVFTEVAADRGLVNVNLMPNGPKREHLARLQAISRELDRAMAELHEHDPEPIRRDASPESVALAERNREIPEREDAAQIPSSIAAPVARDPHQKIDGR